MCVKLARLFIARGSTIMPDKRLKIWESLFRRALAVLDSASVAGMPDDWSFGGGTVLMLKHMHRFSKDVDIFLPGPEYLQFLSPRLNDAADEGSTGYAEQFNSVKIYYPEGEIDYVAASPLTDTPFEHQVLLERTVKVETPLEIVAKKIKFRAADFKARDIYDLALVLQREPTTIPFLVKFLREQQPILQKRFKDWDVILREDFELIDVINFNPSYDDCMHLVESVSGIQLR